MLARSLREKIIVALLRMPGTEGQADRSALIPIEHDAFNRGTGRRSDFERIVDQLDRVGTRHVGELLAACGSHVPGSELEHDLRALCAEVERTIAPPPPRPIPAPSGAFYLRSAEPWTTGELPLDHHAEGNSASPALAWGNVPLQTRSLALVMEDVEASVEEPRYYWGQIGIDPGASELPRDAGVFDPTLVRDVYGRPLASDASNLEGYPGVRSFDESRLYTIRLYALAEDVTGEVRTARDLAGWVTGPGRALAVAELAARVHSPYTNRTFLFGGHPIVGRLLGARPRSVFLALLGAAMVALDFPAWLLGIHSLPPELWAKHAPSVYDNTGFYYQANWMFTYTLMIPSFFAGATAFGIWLRRSAQRLCNRFTGVIRSPTARPYVAFLHDELERQAARVTGFAVVFALITTAIDSYSMFGVYLWSGDPWKESLDWCIAFKLGILSEPRNLVFVILAYLAQTLAIFLFAFVSAKFFAFLEILSRTVRGHHEKDGYVFVPNWSDPDHRMGLSPLAASYNAYNALALAATAFAVFHRFCELGQYRGGFLSYLSQLRAGLAGFDPQAFADLGRWSSMSRGMWTLILCLALPAGVIAYFPLSSVRGYLRRFLARRREELDARLRHGDDPEREELAAELAQLQITDVWPNGRRASVGSMAAWSVLFLTALYPPAPILLVIGFTAAAPVIAMARKALA